MRLISILNTVISRCLGLGDAHQRQIIADTMRGNVAAMSTDTYGSHVVQKALDTVDNFDVVVVAE